MHHRFAIAAAALAFAAGLAGCVSQANWPPVPGDIALNDPNSPATEEVMMAGLRWAINRFPPEGQTTEFTPPPRNPRPSIFARGQDQPLDIPPRAAINLPTGVRPIVYRRVANVAGGLDPSGRRFAGGQGGIVPVTPDTASLPIYHVGWVRIRGDEAYMTVFRPVASLGDSPTGAPIYQEIRLGLRGGLRPWTVDSVRPWDVGSRPAPELNFFVEEQPTTLPAQNEPAQPMSEPHTPATPASENPPADPR